MSFWDETEDVQEQGEKQRNKEKREKNIELVSRSALAKTESRPKQTPKQTPKKKVVDDKIEKLELNRELENLAKTSDFKRLIYKAIFGKSHREGGNKSLDKELYYALKKVRGLK